MATINLIDAFIQLKPVRWLLLVLAVLLLVALVISVIRQKAIGIELELSKGANAEYRAAASIAEVRRKELEAKVEAAGTEVKKITADYTARLDKLNRQKITSTTCAEMVAESVKLLQGGSDE